LKILALNNTLPVVEKEWLKTLNIQDFKMGVVSGKSIHSLYLNSHIPSPHTQDIIKDFPFGRLYNEA
jgi:hypothetical protein